MRTFKRNKRVDKSGMTKKEIFKLNARLEEGVSKAKLRRSGLSDGNAVKSRLVIYRIGDEPVNPLSSRPNNLTM